jgi:TonB family protein
MNFRYKIAGAVILILLAVISCKNINVAGKKSNPVLSSSAREDSVSVKVPVSDNYIIDNTCSQDSGAVYMYCEKMPEFPGGEAAFNNYLRSHIEYPKLAVADKKEGRVVIKFIIKQNGRYGKAEVARSLRPDMDTECLEAVKSMPVWSPGTMDGKPVAVSFQVTVRFLLNSAENLSGIYILPK